MVGLHRRVSLASATILILTLLFVMAKALASLTNPRLFIPYWYQPLGIAGTPTLAHLLPGLLALSVFLIGTISVRKRRAWLFVTWIIGWSTAIPLVLHILIDDPFNELLACTLSGSCSGGFRAALEVTPTILRDWPTLMPTIGNRLPHLALGAPGWAYLYYGLTQALAKFPALSDDLAGILRPLQCNRWDIISLTSPQLASAWFGMASPLWGALTVVPLFYLGRNMANDAIARDAIVWWPLVPALTFFSGSLTIVNPLLATLVVALFWAGLAARSTWRAAALLALAGMVLAGALILTFALLPLLLLCAVLAVAVKVERCRSWHLDMRGLALAGLAFSGGIALIFALYWWQAGHIPLTLLQAAMDRHLATQPPFLSTMALNAWDFILFAGLPACGLALFYAFGPQLERITALAVALGLTLLALLISGIARGEIGRVWMFFTPFVMVLAAAAAQSFKTRQRRLLSIAQAGWLLAVAIAFWPGHVKLPPVPAYSQIARSPLAAPVTPADAVLDDALRLSGYQAEYHPATHRLAVTFHWQALKSIAVPYYFSAVLVAPDGRALPGVTWQPFDTLYPTTCWRPEATRQQPIMDQVELPLGPDEQPGNWWLSLSAFTILQDQTSARLPITLPGGAQDTQIGLGPLPVSKP